MRDRDHTQSNPDSELSQLRSLIGDAQSGPFSLDDILAEYSDHSRPPTVVPVSGGAKPEAGRDDKVVPFPGGRTAVKEPPPAPEPPEPEPEEEPEEDEAPPEPEEDGDKVVDFPEEENPISALLHSLSRKADDYAEHMFEDEDLPTSPETRRIESLVPGVDQEEDERRERRPRRQDPPAPDLSPQELARRYGKGLGWLQVRVYLVLVLFLPALYLVLEPMLPLPPIPNPADPSQALLTPQLRVWISAGLLGAAMLLSGDVLLAGLRRALRLRFGMDTLLTLACAATLADALTMFHLAPREELPYCAINILALFLALRGHMHRKRGLRLACRTAAAAGEPYLVTLDEGKWNGRDTYTKHSAPPDGFGSQIQADDGAQRIFRVVCPLLLAGCLALSALASVGMGRQEHLLWCLSATLTASTTLAAPTIYSRPFHKLARRLARSGAALAGWPGVMNSGKGDGILLTDLDLFPPGAVSLNGIKVFGNWSVERVISYTATLIRDSGSGLDKLFHDLLRSQGAIYRQADRLCCYEGGGLSANIRGDQVLVGSAAFMNLMEVPLPRGLNVKNAVFCAIDGELAGIFALNYSLPDLVFPSIAALLQEKLTPILATRDFNLIPAMLQQRFKLAADKMEFPPVERRRELSAPEQPHNSQLTAVLCREGLYPFSEAVVGARRLRVGTRLSAVLSCVGSAIGLLLACYLTAAEAFASISPVNLLIYLLMWTVPSWLIAGWIDQY